MEKNKTFIIPIQDEKQCEKFNNDFGTNFIPTEDHIDKLVDELYEMIDITGNSGGWYCGDSFEIEIKVKYCPEDK
jgi:hypothetical protein